MENNQNIKITEEEINAFYGYINLLIDELSEEEVEELVTSLEKLEKILDEENNNLSA
jgi:hypothetical protein